MAVAEYTPTSTQEVAQSAGVNVGGFFDNLLGTATNLLGQWGAIEIQGEIAEEIAQIQQVQNQVAQGQAAEQQVPADAQNPSQNGLPSWAPTALWAVGGLAAMAILWKVIK